MEYDAFSQLKQEKHSHKHDSQDKPNETPLISFDEPVYGPLRNDRNNFKLMRGLSGSDPSLSYNSTSSSSHGNLTTSNNTSVRTSDRQPPSWLKGPMANDYVYIFSESDHDLFEELQGKSSSGTSCEDCDTSQKESPPLPPRSGSRNSSEVQQSFKGSPTSRKGSQPIDINLFTSSCDQSDSKLVENRIHRDSFEEINFDDLNKAIIKLNFKSTYEMELAKDPVKDMIQSQNILEKQPLRKPVARSNTLPPQLPPRTYLSSSGTQSSSLLQIHTVPYVLASVKVVQAVWPL